MKINKYLNIINYNNLNIQIQLNVYFNCKSQISFNIQVIIFLLLKKKKKPYSKNKGQRLQEQAINKGREEGKKTTRKRAMRPSNH